MNKPLLNLNEAKALEACGWFSGPNGETCAREATMEMLSQHWQKPVPVCIGHAEAANEYGFSVRQRSENTRAPQPKATQHSGDCTIYSALINGRCFDGVCTCGYGWSLMPDWSQMFSEERAASTQPKAMEGETPRTSRLECDYVTSHDEHRVRYDRLFSGIRELERENNSLQRELQKVRERTNELEAMLETYGHK